MKDERRFKIDFYELSFLIEACIPKVPIARTMFWHDVIDKYWHQMAWDERGRLHEWMNRNGRYQNELEKGNEDVVLFERRFNPENQYKVTTVYNDKEEKHDAFLHKGMYYIKRNTSLLEEYIVNTEKV